MSAPRFTTAALSGLLALVFAWACWVLPWRDWTVFSVLTGLLASIHLITAVTMAVHPALGRRAWRVQSIAALGYLGYASWNIAASAVYIAVLYGGLGRGVAVALIACWSILVFLTVPLAAWGIVTTGGVRASSGRARASMTVLAIAIIVGLATYASRARAQSVLDGVEPNALRDRTEQALQSLEAGGPGGDPVASLMTDEPVDCASVIEPGRAMVVATHWVAGSVRPQARSRCYQGATAQAVLSRLKQDLQRSMVPGPIKLDWILAAAPVGIGDAIVDGLALRPGLDGACLGRRCLMPWQLVALDAFGTHTPLDFIRDLRFGIDLGRLRARLAGTRHPPRELRLRRVETLSLVRDVQGRWHRLQRVRSRGSEPSAKALRASARAAQRHIVAAQAQDGRFRYKLQPFTGRVSFRGFSVPRQAGTTLVLCELGDDEPTVEARIAASLRMLADIEHRVGELGMLHFPASEQVKQVTIGPTALSLIALATCRERFGDDLDPLMGRMTRFLLAMQRDDGGFHPRFDLSRGQPIPGPDPLYAGGQVVFALTMMEQISAASPSAGFPTSSMIATAVEKAMDYYANDYWPEFARQFFFLEENWHCLAARASLSHHRNDDYERFCLDYVKFKGRLILDEQSGVRGDFVGGYGFGNVLPPHSTATAGYGEALAAAMAIKRVRGLDISQDRATMRLVLGFLLHHQWKQHECFACAPKRRVVGGFSEHMASPDIRIDYVQHAWAAMGHGGRMLHDG